MRNPQVKWRNLTLIGLSLLATVAPSRAQQPGDKLWEFTPGTRNGSPAIGPDGTIYVTVGEPLSFANNKTLYALNRDGSKKWEATVPTPFAGSPAVGPDGMIYIGGLNNGPRLYAFNPDGSLKWEFPTNGGVSATPVFGHDGTIYFGSWNKIFYALNPDGSKKWEFDGAYRHAPNIQSPIESAAAVARDGTVYFGNNDSMFQTSRFYALNPDGTSKWELSLGLSRVSAPALDEDGTIYIALANGTLKALRPDGTEKWQFATGGRALPAIGSPAIGTDGTIYVGSQDRKLYALNPDGTKKWEIATEGRVGSTPAIDRMGKIYFSTFFGKFYCLNPDGTLLWTFLTNDGFDCPLGSKLYYEDYGGSKLCCLNADGTVRGGFQTFGGFVSSPNIGEEGNVYFGSPSGTLYAVKTGSPLANNSPWPRLGQDRRHTGLAQGKAAIRFTQHPRDLSVTEGTRGAEFSVTAIGEAPLRYQWRFNGADIPGATNSSFVLRAARISDAGVYHVRVGTPQGSGFSAGATLSVSPLSPFVERELSATNYAGVKMTVTLSATPPDTATAYALEDQPPAGWSVGALSDGGWYDSENHKVKFGPFLDNASRRVTYEVTPPLLVAASANSFVGTGSVGGVSTPITGARSIDLSRLLHPADLILANNGLSVDEVTAYAAAWRRGEVWPIAPNPIPIEFVTRAGTLWKRGERYVYDPGINDAALRWVNASAPRPIAPESFRKTTVSSGSPNGSIMSDLPNLFVPTESFTVRISVAPTSSVTVYAIQDELPAGWTARGISHGGEFDPAHRQVKWGPFFDNVTRALSYEVTPPQTATGVQSFEGMASFDGMNEPILKSRETQSTSRLSISKDSSKNGFELQLRGEFGAEYQVEFSDDLKTWIPLSVVRSADGAATLPGQRPTPKQSFYRAVRR